MPGFPLHLSPLISILFPIRHRQTFTSVYTAAAAFPELDAPKKTGKLDAQTKKSLAVFQRLTGSAPTGTPDAQSAADLAGMQFLLQHAQSTRFVQFPGITLKSGMQDREVRIV